MNQGWWMPEQGTCRRWLAGAWCGERWRLQTGAGERGQRLERLRGDRQRAEGSGCRPLGALLTLLL